MLFKKVSQLNLMPKYLSALSFLSYLQDSGKNHTTVKTFYSFLSLAYPEIDTSEEALKILRKLGMIHFVRYRIVKKKRINFTVNEFLIHKILKSNHPLNGRLISNARTRDTHAHMRARKTKKEPFYSSHKNETHKRAISVFTNVKTQIRSRARGISQEESSMPELKLRKFNRKRVTLRLRKHTAKKQKNERKKKRDKAPKNYFVEMWNEIGFTPSHPNPDTGTYRRAAKTINLLKRGLFFRSGAKLSDEFRLKHKISKSLLYRTWDKRELTAAIKRLSLFYHPSHWPEEKKYIPKSLSDAIYNPRTKTSFFLWAWVSPPVLMDSGETIKEKYKYEIELAIEAIEESGSPELSSADRRKLGFNVRNVSRHYDDIIRPRLSREGIYYYGWWWDYFKSFVDFLFQEYRGIEKGFTPGWFSERSKPYHRYVKMVWRECGLSGDPLSELRGEKSYAKRNHLTKRKRQAKAKSQKK